MRFEGTERTPPGDPCVAYTPDGQILASVGNDSLIKLWDVITGKDLATFGDNVGSITSIAFSPDGSCLAFAGQDSGVRIRDLRTHVVLSQSAHRQP